MEDNIDQSKQIDIKRVNNFFRLLLVYKVNLFEKIESKWFSALKSHKISISKKQFVSL